MSVTIRRADLDDAYGIGRVLVETWRTQYAGIIDADYLNGLSVERRAERWRAFHTDPNDPAHNFVALDASGTIIGMAAGGPTRSPELPFGGELYAIYVLADTQSKGVGRALVRAVATDLLERGFESMIVWVLTANPARGFYERLGGVYAGEQTIEIGGEALGETAYGWADIRPLI